jgi:hypothetical protein
MESVSTKIDRGDYFHAQSSTRFRNENEYGRLMTNFKHDLLAELHIIDHPKAEKLFDIAWTQCYRQGLQSIADLAYAMSELLETGAQC